MEELSYGLDIQGLAVDFGNFKLDDITLRVPKGCITGLIGRNAYKNFDEDKYNALMARFSLPHDLKFSKYSFGMNKKYSLILALCQGADILLLDEPTAGIDPFDRSAVVELIQEFMQDENHTVLFSTHITEDLDRIADYIAMIECGKLRFMEEKEELLNSYRLVQVVEFTEGIKSVAMGLKSTPFGATFLCKTEDVPAGASVKIPSVEELFVALTEDGFDAAHGDDPFGL